MSLLRLAMVMLVLVAPISAVKAQPTNMQIVARLVVECIADLSLPDTLAVEGDGRYESVSSAVIEAVRGAGRTVFVPGEISRAVLGYRVDSIEFAYRPGGRGYERRATVVVTPRLVSDEGEVLHAGRCERSSSDDVGRGDIARLERGAPSEATAPLPPAGFRRRVAEPLLLAGATAVSVILFFTLRSKRSTSE